MKSLQELQREEISMMTMVELTGVFESLASMRISQIKNQVLHAQAFFADLWAIYTQLRVDDLFRFGRYTSTEKVEEKDLFILITAEGGFSGDIDLRLIHMMMKDLDKEKHEIIVIGHHGAIQLAQNNVSFKKYYKMPARDQNINVAPIIREVQRYRSTVVYYQTYESLMVQNTKKIDLSKAVADQGGVSAVKPEDIISEDTYIFEPSTFAVVDHLERSMLHIALSQVILESKLAQYASRFRAMSSAHQKSDEYRQDIHMTYNRAKRMIKDERLKEVINSLKKAQAE